MRIQSVEWLELEIRKISIPRPINPMSCEVTVVKRNLRSSHLSILTWRNAFCLLMVRPWRVTVNTTQSFSCPTSSGSAVESGCKSAISLLGIHHYPQAQVLLKNKENPTVSVDVNVTSTAWFPKVRARTYRSVSVTSEVQSPCFTLLLASSLCHTSSDLNIRCDGASR